MGNVSSFIQLSFLGLCVLLEEDHRARPTARCRCAIEMVVDPCGDLHSSVRTSRSVGCAGRWHLHAEVNVLTRDDQSAWSPMGRLMRIDTPGSGEVLEDFLVMLADLVALPRKLVLVVMLRVESRVTLSAAANLRHSQSTWRREWIAKFIQDGPVYREYWAMRARCHSAAQKKGSRSV